MLLLSVLGTLQDLILTFSSPVADSAANQSMLYTMRAEAVLRFSTRKLAEVNEQTQALFFNKSQQLYPETALSRAPDLWLTRMLQALIQTPVKLSSTG